MLNTVNGIFNAIFGLFFALFRSVDPAWALLVISVVTGVAMLLIYKVTSDQKGIKHAKNLVKGHFLAIRLYRDDIGVMFDTMKNIIVSNLLYMRKSLRPMLFLSIPMVIVLIQTGSRYEFRPLAVGETTLLSLRLDKKTAEVDLSKVELDLPEGLVIDVEPVRINSLREINWRLKAERAGRFDIVLRYEGNQATKTVQVVDSLVPLATARSQNDLSVSLMNPHESTLSSSAFLSLVKIGYPKRDFSMLGFQTHWLIAFFVISLIAVFSLKGLLRVEV